MITLSNCQSDASVLAGTCVVWKAFFVLVVQSYLKKKSTKSLKFILSPDFSDAILIITTQHIEERYKCART